MDESRFRDVLNDYMLPMLAGTKLRPHQPSGPSHAKVAYDGPCCLLLKPSDLANYRIGLTRSQPFSSEERTLVEHFVEEIGEVESMADEDYFATLMEGIPRKVISRFVPSRRGRAAIQRALHEFESLASQTYEGRPVVVALGMTGSLGHGPIQLEDLWRGDFSRVLSNGFDSIYLCGSDGHVFKVAYLPSPAKVGFAPQRLGAIAAWATQPNRVALVLNRNGEVLVFRNGELQFAKRRGAWRHYAHKSVVSRLRVGTLALRQAIYESCLDVSFARAGGCIAVCRAQSSRDIHKAVKQEDFISTKSLARTKLLSKTITKPFHRLDRRLRQELLSMDGATVLQHTGEVITAGAIVSVPGGSTGGGRRAAALRLSRFGLAVKISADGPISGFSKGLEIFAL